MSSAGRRTVVALVAWAAGAALSVSIGLLALSKISDRLDTGPVRESAPWNAAVPSVVPTGTPSSPAAPPTSPAPLVPRGTGALTPSADQVVSSAGGSAVVRCDSDGAYLVSWSPQPGYSIGPVSRGPGTVAEVVFVSGGGPVRLAVRCVGGVAQSVRPPAGGPQSGGQQSGGQQSGGPQTGGQPSGGPPSGGPPAGGAPFGPGSGGGGLRSRHP